MERTVKGERGRVNRAGRPGAACHLGERSAMKMQQVSEHCYAVLNESNLVCDANSGLVNLGDGLLIDTQSDLPHRSNP